jgi:hypothetical protein
MASPRLINLFRAMSFFLISVERRKYFPYELLYCRESLIDKLNRPDFSGGFVS